MERVVGLDGAVRTGLQGALAEAVGGGKAAWAMKWQKRERAGKVGKKKEVVLPDEHHAGVEGGEAREELLERGREDVVVA